MYNQQKKHIKYTIPIINGLLLLSTMACNRLANEYGTRMITNDTESYIQEQTQVNYSAIIAKLLHTNYLIPIPCLLRYQVKMLTQNGLDINAEDSNGNTFIHNAAYDGKSTLIKILLKEGASINQRNSNRPLS